MGTEVDFSKGLWVDTDGDGTPDAPTHSVDVTLVDDVYWAFTGPGFFSGDSFATFGTLENIEYISTVIGTDGVDRIDAGLQNDTLFGGDGNDFLYALNGNDVLNGEAGDDNLNGSGGTLLDIDNDILNGGAGDDTISGSAGRDTLIGGAGSDHIRKSSTSETWISGGSGNDEFDLENGSKSGTLKGGAGKDTLVVNGNIFGLDISGVENLLVRRGVQATSAQLNAFHTIGNYYEINFTIDVTTKGTVDISDNILRANPLYMHASKFGNTLVGGRTDDQLIGGHGNDTLIGGSGKDLPKSGNDVLEGGKGKDHFVFNAPLDSNPDFISDFKHRDDTFDLENAVMTKLGGGNHHLNPDFFLTGAGRQDANDYILYNRSTGDLYYDANANAAGGLHLLADLQNNARVTADDFHVI